MHTSVHYNGLAAHLVLHDEYAILEIKIDSEGLRVKLNAPQFARLQSYFLTFHFLEQVQMLGV